VTLIQRISEIWKEDNLLRRVIKNSSYLFSSNVLSAVLSFIQTMLALRIIDISYWGLIGSIQAFASNVNRFLSFRMSEVVVKHLAPAMLDTDEKKQEAAALVKAAGLVEAITSVVAFAVLLLLVPWAARTFAKDASMGPLFAYYGFILLSNLVFETSLGVLQATHRFGHLARINLVNSIITSSVIGLTFILYKWGNLTATPMLLAAILLAYILGKTYVGLSYVIAATHVLKQILGEGWWKVPLRSLTGKRSLITFALNTNLNGTVNLLFRDNVLLYASALLSLEAAGYFKTALTLIIPVTYILDPFIAPTYTEISRTIARMQWGATLRLLRRLTVIAGGIVLAIWCGWALLGKWLIPLFYQEQALPVYPLLLILIAGYGFASVFQWNRSLFLSFGKPGYPVLVSILMGVIELALMASLVPRYGYLAMGTILTGYFIISIGFISLRGLWEIRRRRRMEAASLP
jgi:O-antigen/teichoic acid export membrane protein